MKRVEANDPDSICMLAGFYLQGTRGFQQDYMKAMELYARAADLGCSKGLSYLAIFIRMGGILRMPSFTMRPRLWQETKWQGTTLQD